MKYIALLVILCSLIVGCASMENITFFPNIENTTIYIDDLEVCCIDTIFDKKLNRNVVFGLSQNDTIIVSSASNFVITKTLNTQTANGFQMVLYFLKNKI